MSESPNPDPAETPSFFSTILSPGSSLHPTFQLITDVAFIMLLFVLFGLAFLTKGNVHILVLIVISGCLWGSVKWFVRELNKAQTVQLPAPERKNHKEE